MTQKMLFDNLQGISLNDAAAWLHVSAATIRNWIKTGYLSQPVPGTVSIESLEKFRNTFAGNAKLVARANKSLKDPHDHGELLDKFRCMLDKGMASGDELAARYEQALSNSYKNKQGVYYTPAEVTQRFFRYLPKDCSRLSFCDPCCGSGNFIITALDYGIHPKNIHGYDIDPFAVELAKKRIYEHSGYTAKNIHCFDFLESSVEANQPFFDIILTNPPWGKKINKTQKEIYGNSLSAGRSVDTSSLFFFMCLNRLADGGYLGLLLQDAFFNIASYETARKTALSLQLKAIIDFGKPFKGLLNKAKGLVLEKKPYNKENNVECADDNTAHSRSQNSFLANPRSIFNSPTTQEESDTISYLYSLPHLTLYGRAKWGLGIVTGNNKKSIRDKPSDGYLAVYRGADIYKDRLAAPTAFIPDDLSLYQQVAPKELYQAETKLIYRFISSELVFFCDTMQRYILNSANLVIPDDDFPITPIQLSQILSSKVLNWMFRSLFDTHKVLRSDIESLPIHVDYFKKYPIFDNCAYAGYLGLEELEDGTFRIKKQNL